MSKLSLSHSCVTGAVLMAGMLLARGQAECPPVQIGNPDGNYLVPGVWGDIPYRTVEGVRLALDAYVQRGPQKRPGVIVVHGGGWTSGSRVSFVGQLLVELTEAGFNWFSIDYRQGPDHPYPAGLDDLRQALEFVRCNAERFRLDPDRIALMGEDSGGHLAAQIAAEKPAGVQALITLAAPLDLETWGPVRSNPFLRRYFRLDETGGFRSNQTSPEPCPSGVPPEACRILMASPIRSVTRGMPAVLALHGTADSEIPLRQPEKYCLQVRQRGGRCDLIPVEGAIHRPENWTPSQWGYKPRLIKWLAQTLEAGPLSHEPYPSHRLRKDIVYQRIPKAGGDALELKLDAFIPDGAGPFPALVLVHGGGWEAGDKVTYLAPLLEPLSQAGFAWFSIDYRLTPEYRHTDQLQDLRRAVRFVRHEARRFNIDPARIALLGESASGQMALLVGSEECPGNRHAPDPVDRTPCDVKALVSLYGVYDLRPLAKQASPGSLPWRLFGIRVLDDAAREVLKRYSPLYQVRNLKAPLLLVHGTNEILWEQAVRLQQRLIELNLDYQLIRLEGAPHGLENWEGHPEWEGYKKKLIRWLRQKL